MKILNLVFLEKVSALETFRDLIDFLRLRARDIIRCELQVAREPALLAKIPDQVRLTHQIILSLHHDRRRAGSLPESRLNSVYLLLMVLLSKRHHLTVYLRMLLLRRSLLLCLLRFGVSLLLVPDPLRVKLVLHDFVVGPVGLRSGR